MKIWFDDIVYSLQKAGGISVFWHHVTKKTKFNANHMRYNNSEKNAFSNRISEHTYYNHITLPVILYRFFNPRLKSEKKPFLFHSSYFRYCKNRNAINITTVYDFIYEYFRKDLKSLSQKHQKKQAVLHSDGVICISESTKRDLIKYYPEYKGLIKVIHCGYDSETYFYEAAKKEKIILSVGARGGYKRFDLTVRIVKELKDCKLVIVGGGQLTKSERVLLDKEIPGRYSKAGYLSNDQLRNLYNKAFFLSYCSDYEGFGIPLIEAQSCGCPVVCQAKSSIPEVVNDSAVFINPDNIAFTIKSIKKLYDNEFYDSIVKKGLDNVKRFSWEKCNNEVNSFYNEILKFKRSKEFE